MFLLILHAHCRYIFASSHTLREQWKLETKPSRKVAQGMKVVVQSTERLTTLAGLEGGRAVARDGVIGKRVRWEKRWVEYELVVEGAVPQSISLLVPIDWCRLGVLDRYKHFWESSSLPDLIAGPFPEYENGEPRGLRRRR